MADSASEFDLESDASSVEGHTGRCEQLQRQVDLLSQQNRMLKTEIEHLKQRNHDLNAINQQLRRNSVSIQAKAEQEEEFISNTLQRQITELKKDKETLVVKYEEEEERLVNELNRKLFQLQKDKERLEVTLAKEQEDQVAKLKRRIDRLESERDDKQTALDKLRYEKVELENALEQEQEALVHRLWKKMEKLEDEKRQLQEKLETSSAPISSSPSLQNLSGTNNAVSGSNSSGGGVASHQRPHHSVSLCFGMQRQPSQQQQQQRANMTHGSLRPGSNSTSFSASSPKQQQQHHRGSATGGDSNESFEFVGWQSDTPYQSIPPPSNQIPSQSPMDLDCTDNSASNSSSHLSRPDLLTSPPCAPAAGGCDRPHRNSFQFHSISGGGVVCGPNAAYVSRLRDEVNRLRAIVASNQVDQMACSEQERSAILENGRLKKLLQAETERRELLFRNFSGSESSLEMEDERQFNEASRGISFSPSGRLRTTSEDCTLPFFPGPGAAFASAVHAAATVVTTSRPTSPTRYCRECGQCVNGPRSTPPPPTPPSSVTSGFRTSGGFIKPSTPRVRVPQAHPPPSRIMPFRSSEGDGTGEDEEEEEEDEDEDRCKTPPATARNTHD